MSYTKPYTGVKILDLSQGIAGPYASALLSQQGAEVIKVEPRRGDWMRPKEQDGPFGDMTPSFVIANLGKRSIVVDLKTTEGVAIVRDLAAKADIFMEGFRPGVIDRLGLGYKVIADLNPRVIYLSVSGFGQEGPLRERPATDGVLQAFSGFMSVNRGPDNLPHRAGVVIVDLATSLYNLQAMQAALWARQTADEGCYIDNSLLRSAASLYNMSLASEHLLGVERPLGIYPSGIFATTDGFVNVICLHDHNFPDLCDILGLGEFRDHPDYKTVVQREYRRDVLEPAIREAMARQSSDYWCERLSAAGLLHERINTFSDFMAHPQPADSGALSWFDHPDVGTMPLANPPGVGPYDPEGPLYAPHLGEHTIAVLRDNGYEAAQIDDLVAQGIVSVRQGERS